MKKNKFACLSKGERQNPKLVLKEFFDTYQLPLAKQSLTKLVETSLTTENEHFETALDRTNLIHFYRLMEGLLEAAAILQENAGGKR